ncbi:DUF397 domain-containing protein [Kitasatospora sp. NPDC088134]|uniref:DUF397 domain-containing protein n=1 Tax=Kitasatospora sp. NPDC088134 TaxID=3364071 RepID=UPI0037F87997
MAGIDLSGARWVKSSYSDNGGACVEVAPTASAGHMPVRDSKDPQGPVLVFTRAEYAAFLDAVVAGEFGGV